MEESDALQSLAALAQPMRLRVFRALVGAAPDGLTPGALATLLDVPTSTLSFHLKELAHAGLVTQERDGRNLIYRAALARMTALLDYLSAHCCQGAPCGLPAPACCPAPSPAAPTPTPEHP
jgi:DNA-binding transcriptional ArsR family regulator